MIGNDGCRNGKCWKRLPKTLNMYDEKNYSGDLEYDGKRWMKT
jgi:hypothetical protein